MECFICKKAFNSKGNYKRHLISVHLPKSDHKESILDKIADLSDSRQKNFKCQNCNKQFSSQYYLTRHQTSFCGNLGKFHKCKTIISNDLTTEQKQELLSMLSDELNL